MPFSIISCWNLQCLTQGISEFGWWCRHLSLTAIMLVSKFLDNIMTMMFKSRPLRLVTFIHIQSCPSAWRLWFAKILSPWGRTWNELRKYTNLWSPLPNRKPGEQHELLLLKRDLTQGKTNSFNFITNKPQWLHGDELDFRIHSAYDFAVVGLLHFCCSNWSSIPGISYKHRHNVLFWHQRLNGRQ